MAAWSFVLTDMQFNPVGELLNVSNTVVQTGINRVSTCAMQMRMDNPQASRIAENLGYIKGYRDGALRFYGPIISVEESADRDAQTMQVNAAGIEWMLAHRLAFVPSPPDAQYTLDYTTAIDRAAIFADLLYRAQQVSETHIDTSVPVSAASATTYQVAPFKPMSEVLLDLAATLDGFDWQFVPMDNAYHGSARKNTLVINQKIAQFKAAPTIGVQRNEAIFEYGAGRHNIVSYKRTISRDTQANVVYHTLFSDPSQIGTVGLTLVAKDIPSTQTWGYMEDMAQADIMDVGLRSALINEHVRVRKNPRQVIDVQPHLNDGTGRVPTLGADYDVGDTVRAHIVNAGNETIDARVRVWAVTCALDNNGVETLTLSLSDDGGS